MSQKKKRNSIQIYPIDERFFFIKVSNDQW